MFTEEKIRAIELYFKYGKKLTPVVRELGYPSKINLQCGIRSWDAGGGAKNPFVIGTTTQMCKSRLPVEHYLDHCCLAFTSITTDYPFSDVFAI